MQILGIDYGRKKIGMALADAKLAEPYKVIRFQSINKAVEEIIKVVKLEKVEKVIVGVSEGRMGEETKIFASALSFHLSVKVETFDETLSTRDAQRLSSEAGISLKKRRKMEDAYAAAVMLQNFLDCIRRTY